MEPSQPAVLLRKPRRLLLFVADTVVGLDPRRARHRRRRRPR
jgi:hypothetical protein